MTKIIVNKTTDEQIYIKLISILSGVKLVGGNIFLNKTIHNHPAVKEFLLEHLQSDLIEVEREILNSQG